MKAIYDVPAPAKLNTFLHVVGRRADGYHLIQSVFMLIDWYDTLHFELRTDGKVSRRDLLDKGNERLPAQDLTVRAAKALQNASGTNLGVDISLEKRIPSNAGMGGGSSDAASCLLALQRLWNVRLPQEKLHEIALSLGADVSFFLCGGNAWVEGIGEQISPVKLPTADFVVIKPRSGLSTPAIFASPELKRDTETATIESFAENTERNIFEFGRNDLQPVSEALCPEISRSLDWLSAAKLNGRMTGSGSAVFAQLRHEATLPIASSKWQIRKCSNLQSHPLIDW